MSGCQYEEGPTKEDLLAADEAAARSLFGKPSLRNRSTVFSLGSRGEVLGSLEAAVLVPHAAHKADTRYPLEALFRSVQYALVDNACREYLFLAEFFMVHGSAAQDLFASVMGKTLHSCAVSRAEGGRGAPQLFTIVCTGIFCSMTDTAFILLYT